MSVLVALILLYRRRLSGRGPLQRVVCTFHHAESCSAYGLRMAQQHGAWRALRLIRRRLRRCSQAAIYQLPTGLGWGELYDRSAAEIVNELALANEEPASRAVVFASSNAVALARGALPPFTAERNKWAPSKPIARATTPAPGRLAPSGPPPGLLAQSGLLAPSGPPPGQLAPSATTPGQLAQPAAPAATAMPRLVVRRAGFARPGSQSALILMRRFITGALLAAASIWAAFAIHLALILPLLFALVWRGRLALRQRNQRHRLRRQSRAYALAQAHRAADGT